MNLFTAFGPFLPSTPPYVQNPGKPEPSCPPCKDRLMAVDDGDNYNSHFISIHLRSLMFHISKWILKMIDICAML